MPPRAHRVNAHSFGFSRPTKGYARSLTIGMGVDGTNTLYIRGSKEILDEIEQTGAAIDTSAIVAKRFFGTNNVTVVHREPRFLILRYEFRNEPVYEYLKELLAKYPTCWMKNLYDTEIGACGLWIGRFCGKEMSIQELKWTELCDEEQSCLTDFSIAE